MKFSIEDLMDKMMDGIHPFEMVAEKDEPTGHRSQRMIVYTFKFSGKFYSVGVPYSDDDGLEWDYVDVDLPEVEPREKTIIEYVLVESVKL